MADRVFEVMNPKVVFIGPLSTVGEASEIAQRRRVRHLVVAQKGDVVGVLCTCDLRDAPVGEKVARYMSRPALTVSAEASLEQAAEVMRDFAVGCLPVVTRGRLVGIMTKGDLRRAGAPLADRRRCQACGSTSHVRRLAKHGGVSFCWECIEKAEDVEDDVGGSG